MKHPRKVAEQLPSWVATALFISALVVAVACTVSPGWGQAGWCRSTNCGVNVPRNANTTPPKVPPKPDPDWCGKQGDDLKKKYDQAMQAYEAAEHRYNAAKKAYDDADAKRQQWNAQHANDHVDLNSPTPPSSPTNPYDAPMEQAAADRDAAQSQMDAARHQIAGLRETWNSLKGKCGFPGDIGGGRPPSSSGGGGGKNSGGGGGSSGAGGGGSPGGSRAPKTMGQLIRAVEVLTPPGMGGTPRPAPKGVGLLIGRDLGAKTELRHTLQRIGNPPTLRDSVNVIATVPAVAPTNMPADVSPAVRAGLDAVALLERESAFLSAYVTSHGRYKGAVAAGDSVAATAQGEAMVAMIDSAIASGSQAEAQQEETQRLLLARFDSTARTGSHGGARTSSSPAVTGDISPELRDEFVAGGMTRSEIDALVHERRATTPAEAAKELAALRGELGFDSVMRQGLGATAAASGWPPPDEMPSLADAAATARQIRAAPMYEASDRSATGTTGDATTDAAAGTATSSTATPATAVTASDQGGWFERHRDQVPRPQLWWAVPIVGVGALAGYARWLKRRESGGTHP